MPSDISSTPVIGGADPAAFARVLEIARRNQNGVSDESAWRCGRVWQLNWLPSLVTKDSMRSLAGACIWPELPIRGWVNRCCPGAICLVL